MQDNLTGKLLDEISRCETILSHVMELPEINRSFLEHILSRSITNAKLSVATGDAVEQLRALADLQEYNE